MPIDDALEDIKEERKEKVKELEVAKTILKPSNLFPVDKCVAAYLAFSEVKNYLGDADTDYVADTVDLKKALDNFSPYEEFYLASRDSFDILLHELKNWEGVFQGVFDPRVLEDKKSSNLVMPDSIYGWILGLTDIALKKINKAGYSVQDRSEELPWFECKAKRINEILSELYNQKGLVEIILLGRALGSTIRNINEDFTVFKVPAIYHPPIPAQQYLERLQELQLFADGKKRIYYNFINGELCNLRDISPKSQKTKRSFFEKLIEPLRS